MKIYEIMIDVAPILISIYLINSFKREERYRFYMEKIEELKASIVQLLILINSVQDGVEFYVNKIKAGEFSIEETDELEPELRFDEVQKEIEKIMKQIVKTEYYLPELKEKNYIKYFREIQKHIQLAQIRMYSEINSPEDICKEFLEITDNLPLFYDKMKEQLDEIERMQSKYYLFKSRLHLFKA